LIVKVAVWVCPLSVPEIVAVVTLAAPEVLTVNVAPVCPAGTVTDDGMLATELLVDSATTDPVGEASPFKVTEATELLPV